MIRVFVSGSCKKRLITEKFAKKRIASDMRMMNHDSPMSSKEAKAEIKKRIEEEYIIMSSEQEKQCREDMYRILCDLNYKRPPTHYVSVLKSDIRRMVHKWDPSLVNENYKAYIMEGWNRLIYKKSKWF